MNRKSLILFLVIAMAASVTMAQTPIVVVPAASAAPAKTTVSAGATAPAAEASSLSAAIKLLQDMKAANAETLKKQEGVLQQLDELQKAAEQIKAFSKRS